jgi:uroporphyrinogen-III decarboxylase
MTIGPEEGKPPQELRREREQRIMDTVRLKPTDRVSVGCELGLFMAKYAGVPSSAAYYDFDVWMAAVRKTLEDFRPDTAFVRGFTPGKALEFLAPRFQLWPGQGTDYECGTTQNIEIEGLKDDEYDLLMQEPADYIFRRHLPRQYGALEFLSMLPQLSSTAWFHPWAGDGLAMLATDPQMEAGIQNLLEAGREMRKWLPKMAELDQLLLDYAIPPLFQGAVLPPFDVISHSVRGMKGTMLDMFRRPDKLLELCEFLLERDLAMPTPPPNEYGNTRMFMTNTRGSDNFMSNEQFETFYWPTCKKLLLTLIERGMTPYMFFEGNFDAKLEYLLELPKGSMIVRLDRTDIFRAKEILGGHLCLEGNVPITLLQMGTVQEVKDHCKKLIDVVGEGGGFIMSPRSSSDEVKPENLKAMIDYTKEYGRY